MSRKAKPTSSDDMTTFTMRINKDVKEALIKIAQQDRRSLGSLIEKIGVDYLKAKGIIVKGKSLQES